MDLYITVSIKVIRGMGTGSLLDQMEISTMGTGKIIRLMGPVNFNIPMVIIMKEIGRMIRQKAMGCIFILMGIGMSVNGKIIKKMGKARNYYKLDLNIMVYLKME